MKYVTLNNGVKMPILGYGVFQIPKEETEKCVLDALEVGYRSIDTAQSYFNEDAVGGALQKSDIPRKELFITTKIWIDNYGYDKAKASVEESMKKLKVDYLDLVLLHQPFSDYYGAYRALEDLYEESKVRAIGVSNFYPDRLSDIAAFNKIKPQINQVETNPLNQQIEAQKNMEKLGVQIESWAPFGEGKNDMFDNPTLKEIAEKRGKSVAQIILRWLTERGVVVIPKSTRIERMRENFASLDFELTNNEMENIAALDTKTSLFFDHQTPEAVDMFLGFIKERKNRK
ncbi:MAG: aldo/keto reductase [Helicobacteraceae bacterium]|jgi:diketogulonate reductase-like aldo/keto reductase|nr:aldo/keto reductase [Helicobacteraceae bacterium]